MSFRYDILALCALFALALLAVYRRDRARIRRARAGYFDECLPLVAAHRLTQDDVDFPALEGTYRGYRVRLQPVVDHIAVRKLPSLWILVTLFAELPGLATLDLLVRPQNVEFYSPSATLPTSLPLPAGWPAHAILRTDDADRLPPVDLLTPHMRFFDDPKAKEMVIAAKGVRLVYQASEGERAYYMVLRHARFSDTRLPLPLAQRLLDRAIAIYETVAANRRMQ